MLLENHSQSRQETKPSLKRPMERSEKEIYERTGLGLVLKMFHYFGFRLRNDPAQESCVNWIYVGVIITLTTFSYLTFSYFMSFVFITSEGSWSIENVGFYLVMGSGYTAALINSVLGVIKAKEYSVLLRSLASAIDAIPNPELKLEVVRRIKNTVLICCVPFVLSGCVVEIINFFSVHYYLKNESQHSELIAKLFTVICLVTNVVWFSTMGALYLFTNALILIVCGVINEIIDAYLKPKTGMVVRDVWVYPSRWDGIREEEFDRNVMHHKMISSIVEKSNSALANFLLLTLSVEIVISIAFVKMITIKGGTFSFAAYANSFHILFLILKVWACAKVNDNLKSSISLKKFPASTNFSNEQVSCFILYQNDQQINRDEITYGNLFPVRKTFLFTIAGTALTYALVLHGV